MDAQSSATTVAKYRAAKNALVAKYTFESLDANQKRRIDTRIIDLLISSGVPVYRAVRYKATLRETQYYGMAAVAMAFIGIKPALQGILYRDRWKSVQNPLVALTGAEKEIQMAANEIVRKHRVWIKLSDDERRYVVTGLLQWDVTNQKMFDRGEKAIFDESGLETHSVCDEQFH